MIKVDRIEEEIRFISIALQKLQKSDPEYQRLSKRLSQLLSIKNDDNDLDNLEWK